jgi:hypothetical protein
VLGALVHGVSDIAGTPGDVKHMYDVGSQYALSKGAEKLGLISPEHGALLREDMRSGPYRDRGVPHWPALDWTLESLKLRLGDTPVEVQTNRVSDPEYEIRSQFHKQVMPFPAFIDRIISGPDNDIYLTAHNAVQSRDALEPLFADIAPLPSFVWPASEGLLWLGGRTVTPLHHDLCNILLCQIMGRKHVRLISPYQVDRLENHMGVHSRLGWVTDEMAAARGLVVKDFVLKPGQALFLPVGWWHCVRALDPSASISFNTFMWTNHWQAGFPPG